MSFFFFLKTKMEKEMQIVEQFVLSYIPAYWYWGKEAVAASLYVWTFPLSLEEILPKAQESLFLSLLEAQVAHDSS